MDSGRSDRGTGNLIFFFMLALIAWLIWGPQALRKFGMIGWAPSLQSPLNAITVWAPTIAAVLVLCRESGSSGVKSLFGQLKKWKAGIGWFLAALLLEPARWLAALGIDRALGRAYELKGGILGGVFGEASAYMIPVAVIFTLPNALGEELGWRGFALPRLQRRSGALPGTFVIGLFWGFWHIPAWLAWGAAELTFLPVFIMVLNAVPAAVIFTWMFNRTGGNIWIPVIYHSSIANKGYFLSDLPTYTENILLWIVAAVIVITGKLAPLERNEHPGGMVA